LTIVHDTQASVRGRSGGTCLRLHVIVCTRIVCRLHAARQKRNPARDGGAPTQGEVLKNTRISQLSLDARTQGAASGRGHVRRSGAAAAVAAISASRPLKKMAVAPYTACGAPEGRGCEEAISRLLAPLRASASRLLRGNGRAARAQVRAVPPKVGGASAQSAGMPMCSFPATCRDEHEGQYVGTCDSRDCACEG
jgi:hypothetical protein